MNWFCNPSGLNCVDLLQAISDVRLQLNVTLVFLAILIVFIFLFGWVSRWLTARQHNKQQQPVTVKRPMNYKLTLRSQRGHYNPVSPVHPVSADHENEQKNSWWSDYWQGISTEFFGAVVTTILLGLGVLVFAQYQDIQNQKEQLILQMGSDERVWAVEAVRQLSVEGWLTDGTLTGAYLFDVNLTDAYLFLANLTNAYLFDANLTNATLYLANLTDANLISANLTEANLGNANLTNAYLFLANLTDANLGNANLTETSFNQETILPDGTNWTPDTDMTRFTDPEHSDYWDACTEVTPAPWYCGR